MKGTQSQHHFTADQTIFKQLLFTLSRDFLLWLNCLLYVMSSQNIGNYRKKKYVFIFNRKSIGVKTDKKKTKFAH